MIVRTTPAIPNNLAKNLLNPFPPVTFAMVKKSDKGNVIIANNNPNNSILLSFKKFEIYKIWFNVNVMNTSVFSFV